MHRGEGLFCPKNLDHHRRQLGEGGRRVKSEPGWAHTEREGGGCFFGHAASASALWL